MSLKDNVIDFPKSNSLKIKNAQKLLNSKSVAKALNAFRELEIEGETESYMYLGAIFEFGGVDLEPNYKKAKYYYDKSVELVGAVESYYGLARLHYFGKGVPINYGQAYYYYKKVYDEYYDSFSPYMIGKMCLYGLGVKKDLDVAENLLLESVNRGHILALSELSVLEKERGNLIQSFLYRLRAGYKAFRVAGSSPNDARLREK